MTSRAVSAHALLVVASCKRGEMASPAQCEKLIDRFIDLKLSEDPRAPTMTSEARAHLRAEIAALGREIARFQRIIPSGVA